MTLSGTMALPANCLRLLPDKRLFKIVVELIRNPRFTLTTGDNKKSRLYHLNNGVPQRLVLALLIFNFFIFTSTSALYNFQNV